MTNPKGSLHSVLIGLPRRISVIAMSAVIINEFTVLIL